MAAKAYRSEPSVESYIGRWINLISTRRVRYEGIFHYVHPEGSFIGIRNVRCCGSEGRKTGRQVPASEEVSDILFFRVSDIENIMVEPLPPVQTSPPHNDPVIIELKQPRNSSMSSASTQGSRTISDPSFRAVQLSRPWSTFQERLPIYRAGKNIESRGIVPPVSNSYESGIPMTWQEIYALTSGPSHFPRTHIHPTSPGLSISHSLPQHAHISNVNLLSSSGIRSFNKAASPSPPPVSSNSNLVSTSVQNPNAYSLFTTTPFSEFFPPHASPATLSPTQASLFASESSLNWMPNISLVNSHSTSVFGFDYPLEPPLGYINASEASVPQNSNSSPNDPSNEAAPSFPFQTISQSMLSDISSLRSIQSNTSLPLVSSGHLQHPSDSMLLSSPLVQTIHEYAKYKAQEPTEPLAYELSPPAASMKEPLPKHPSYSMPFSSSHVPNIHDDSMFKSREPKISESLTYEHPSPAKFMKEPLLPLPRQSSSSMLLRSPEVHTILENTKLKGQEPKIKSESGPWMYKLPPQAPQATAMKEPLFPLPNVAHKGFSEPVVSFTEDFDFMAMNDNQFNKAEIWRYFGEGKAPIESDDRGEPSNVNAIRVEDEEYLNTEIQAYSQFDFFDELSYTFEPGTNSGRDLISEQVKVNTETPGDFPRHPSNRGGHLGFHGGNGGREPSNRGDSRGFRGGNDGSFVWHPVQ